MLQADYINILGHLKEKIRLARIKAAVAINTELIQLYWEIGYTILKQQHQAGWGARIIDKLAADLKNEFPDFKGLSVRNLKYMRAFADAWPGFVQQDAAQINSTELQNITIVQQAVAQLPWGHHQLLLTKLKNQDERLFYIKKSVENSWSRNILALQIDNNLYKRQGSAITNFSERLPAPQSDLANESLKNPYVFDFLSFSQEMKERDLENALTQHLKKFMLELGKGFSYVGNQKNFVVDGDDFFLDLLFYNYQLHCFVVFELKIGDFKPEFAGKLNFYVNAINKQLKGAEDKPTVGVLLCKTPNEMVIRYSLQGIESPIGVADYQLAEALPKQLKGNIPTVEELEEELDKEYETLQKPVDKKLDKVKELLAGLNQPALKQKRSPQACFKIFKKVVLPIRKGIRQQLKKKGIAQQFEEMEIITWAGDHGYRNDNELLESIKDKEVNRFVIAVHLRGCKPAGPKAFDVWKEFNITTDYYGYSFDFDLYKNQKRIPEKMYNELPGAKYMEDITNKFLEGILDQIEINIDRIKQN